MTTGEKIKAARKAAGWTQKQLAEKIGAATGTIQQYELNKRIPRTDQLFKLSEVLGIDVAVLAGHEEPPPPTDEDYDNMPDYLKLGSLYFQVPTDSYDIPTEKEFHEMSPAEQEYVSLRILADTAPDKLRNELLSHFETLNKDGKVELVRTARALNRDGIYTYGADASTSD